MKLKLKYKVKSGALQFVLFIALLIALILSGLVLYVYTFVHFKEQSKATIENIQLLDSGISYALENSEDFRDTLSLNFIENEHQTIKVHVSQWGIYEKVFVETRHRQKRFHKSAIIGSVINTQSPSLYLQETNSPLALVGTTKIIGDAFLPMQGVRTGYIAGDSYYNDKLIYGSTSQSSEKLPELNKECVAQLYRYAELGSIQI